VANRTYYGGCLYWKASRDISSRVDMMEQKCHRERNVLINEVVRQGCPLSPIIKRLNYLGCHLGSSRYLDTQNKLQRINYMRNN
jgi:hypothetical protein